jgi:hypothetical protein
VPTHRAGRVGRGRPRNQPIVESLVIPFEMIVLHKLRDRTSEVPLPQRNHATETFVLDRANESLGVSIRVRGSRRCQDHADASIAKLLLHRSAPFLIPIADEQAMANQHASSAAVTRHHLAHE